MQVVVCNQVGSLDQLTVEERPSPDLYPACVRIAVTARGANTVIDSTLSANEIKEQAKQISGGGVDYIYDPVGGEVGETCLRALTDDGQYLVIGFVAAIPMLPANQVLLRNRRITGVDWGAWAMKNPDLNNANLVKVLELIDGGKVALIP